MRRRRLLTGCLALLVSLAALDLGISAFLIRNESLMGRMLPPAGYRNWGGKQDWLIKYRNSLSWPEQQRPKSVFDSELGWTSRPHFSTERGSVRINSIGARGGREYEPEPPEGALRLAAFGESFTFCSEVEDDASWPVQLEALEPSWEVVNFGVAGYGTDQALLRMRRRGILSADVACMGLMLENVGRNVTRDGMIWRRNERKPSAKPRFVLDGNRLELVPLPFGSATELADAVEDGSIGELLAEHEYWAQPAFPDFLWRSSLVRIAAGLVESDHRSISNQWMDLEGEPFRTTVAILEAFRDEALAAGARRAVVLVFPLERDLRGLLRDEPRYWAGLLEELDRRGIAYIDLTRPLEEAYRSTSPASSLYERRHLSRQGNAVVANSLRDWVAGAGLR